MRKFLQKSSHDAVITIFILAKEGKMTYKTPFVARVFKFFFEKMAVNFSARLRDLGPKIRLEILFLKSLLAKVKRDFL